jgi:hypothetical protein
MLASATCTPSKSAPSSTVCLLQPHARACARSCPLTRAKPVRTAAPTNSRARVGGSVRGSAPCAGGCAGRRRGSPARQAGDHAVEARQRAARGGAAPCGRHSHADEPIARAPHAHRRRARLHHQARDGMCLFCSQRCATLCCCLLMMRWLAFCRKLRHIAPALRSRRTAARPPVRRFFVRAAGWAAALADVHGAKLRCAQAVPAAYYTSAPDSARSSSP